MRDKDLGIKQKRRSLFSRSNKITKREEDFLSIDNRILTNGENKVEVKGSFMKIPYAGINKQSKI